MISDIVSHMLQGDEVFIPEEVKVDVMNNLYAAIQKNWSKKRNEGLDESEMVVTNEEKPRSNAPRNGVGVNVGDPTLVKEDVLLGESSEEKEQSSVSPVPSSDVSASVDASTSVDVNANANVDASASANANASASANASVNASANANVDGSTSANASSEQNEHDSAASPQAGRGDSLFSLFVDPVVPPVNPDVSPVTPTVSADANAPSAAHTVDNTIPPPYGYPSQSVPATLPPFAAGLPNTLGMDPLAAFMAQPPLLSSHDGFMDYSVLHGEPSLRPSYGFDVKDDIFRSAPSYPLGALSQRFDGMGLMAPMNDFGEEFSNEPSLMELIQNTEKEEKKEEAKKKEESKKVEEVKKEEVEEVKEEKKKEEEKQVPLPKLERSFTLKPRKLLLSKLKK